MLNNHLRTG